MIRALLPFLLVPGLAVAQVNVNPGALDSLRPAPVPSPAKPATEKPAPAASATRRGDQPAERRPAAKPATPAATSTKPAAPAATAAKPSAAKPSGAKPGPVRIAPAPPASPALAPVVQAPAVKPLPPPTPPVAVPNAQGAVSPIPGGIRITFGGGKADLNTVTEGALRDFGRVMKADPSVDVNVYAYAEGVADDPSTPRRMSLSRALAARAVLMSEGVESTRIYVRALGATPSSGPPDRVDVTRSGTPPPN